jgi:hypothetical protein
MRSRTGGYPLRVATKDPTPLSWTAAFIEGDGDRPLAQLVSESTLSVWQEPDEALSPLGSYYPDWYPRTVARLVVPGDLYAAAVEKEGTIGWALAEALDGHLNEWRLEAGPGREWSNQGAGAPYRWRGMRFRSKTERRIAAALERANVAFFPNSRGRLGTAPDFRETREPDFLVVTDGKLGILEVDGDDYHPPERAAEDHDRDRAFRRHGIRVVERYSATECWGAPDQVVAEFLQLLRLNG